MPVALIANPSAPLGASRSAACGPEHQGRPAYESDRFLGAKGATTCEVPPEPDPAACEAFLETAWKAFEVLVTFLVGYTAPAFFAALML